jgi:hypothetical protein
MRVTLYAIILLALVSFAAGKEIYCHYSEFDENRCCKGACFTTWEGAFPQLTGSCTLQAPASGRTVVDLNMSGSDVYLNGRLYWVPAWDSYSYLESFGDVDIYSKSEEPEFIDAEYLEDWLEGNGNATYYFFGLPAADNVTIGTVPDFLFINSSYIRVNGLITGAAVVESEAATLDSIRIAYGSGQLPYKTIATVCVIALAVIAAFLFTRK